MMKNDKMNREICPALLVKGAVKDDHTHFI